LAARAVVVRLDNATVHCVSDMNTRRHELRAFVAANGAQRKMMPRGMALFHMEVQSYFFPATNDFPGLFICFVLLF
jgi:hypothetical protein